MLSEMIDSVKENLRQKPTNPLLGTLVIVWVVHHWEFLYRVFNFEETKLLEDRITYIGSVLGTGAFVGDLFVCIGISIVVLVITYFLLALSRLILNAYEDLLMPQFNKLTDTSRIVTKEKFLALRTEYDDLEKKYFDEMRRREEAEKRYEELYKKMSDDPKGITEKLSEKASDNQVIAKIIGNLKSQGILEVAANAIREIQNKKGIPTETPIIKTFLTYDVIKESSRHSPGVSIFQLTPTGQMLKDEMIMRSIL